VATGAADDQREVTDRGALGSGLKTALTLFLRKEQAAGRPPP
jgi:hypothetical protein